MSERNVYVCPVHGLIESPSLYTEEDAEGNIFNSEWYCPINLSGRDGHHGITDDVCGKTVAGPHDLATILKGEARWLTSP